MPTPPPPAPAPDQLRKKLSTIVVKWSGLTDKNERRAALMSVFDAVGVPRPAKEGDTSDADLAKLIAWAEDRVEKGVEFFAAVAKKSDDVQAKPSEKPVAVAGVAPARKTWQKPAKPGPAHVHYWRLKLIANAEALKKSAKTKDHLNTSVAEMVGLYELHEKLPEPESMPEADAAIKYKTAAESKIDWSQYLIPF